MTTRVSGNQARPVLPKPIESAENQPAAVQAGPTAAAPARPKSQDGFTPAQVVSPPVVTRPESGLPITSEPRPMSPEVYETLAPKHPELRTSTGEPRWVRNATIELTLDDDGAYVDAYGEVLPASMDINDVQGLLPEDGSQPLAKTVFINGIAQNRGQMNGMMQQFANMTQTEVVGLYNATEGWLKDAVQTVGDRLDLGDNSAVDSLKGVILEQIRDNEPLRIMGYSQGSVIASRALQDVKETLIGEGMSEADVETKFRELLQVETFATAHSHYPDGPSYVHHMNKSDPITLFSFYAFGQNSPLVHPGEDAAVHWFNSGILNHPHSINTYEKNHQRFEDLVNTGS